jgi:hypothetical protein
MTADKARIIYSKWQLEKQKGFIGIIAKRAAVGLILTAIVFISKQHTELHLMLRDNIIYSWPVVDLFSLVCKYQY